MKRFIICLGLIVLCNPLLSMEGQHHHQESNDLEERIGVLASITKVPVEVEANRIDEVLKFITHLVDEFKHDHNEVLAKLETGETVELNENENGIVDEIIKKFETNYLNLIASHTSELYGYLPVSIGYENFVNDFKVSFIKTFKIQIITNLKEQRKLQIETKKSGAL